MSDWKNRITGHGEEDPRQIMANPFNFRIHGKAQKAALSGALNTLGLIQTVLKNTTTGHLIDGHLRVATAIEQNQKSIPVTYVELTEAEEAQALLSLDPIAAMARTDSANMETLLRMTNTDDPLVMDFLTRLAADNKISWGNPDDPEPEIKPEQAAILQAKWRTETGQIWQVGNHRIICGDSTEAQTVSRLMGTDRVDQLNTDPPYGVDLESQNEMKARTGHGGRTDNAAMINDNIKDYREFFGKFLKLIPWAKKNTVYIFMQRKHIAELFQAMEDAGVYISEDLVWVKSSPAFGRQDYHHQHEWIIYGWAGTHEFYRTSSSTLMDFDVDPATLDRETLVRIVAEMKRHADIIRVDRNRVNVYHPTMKPVSLVQRLILDGTKRNAIVYDPFSGSGTTSIACHNTGRQARAVEQDPRYVAVWLERLTEASGLQAEKIA